MSIAKKRIYNIRRLDTMTGEKFVVNSYMLLTWISFIDQFVHPVEGEWMGRVKEVDKGESYLS